MHSRQPMAYAYSWYLDIVSPGWKALVAGDYEAVFPLTGNWKMGIHYLHQPFFTQQLGIFKRTDSSGVGIEDFIHAIPPRYRFIEICLNESNIHDLKTVPFRALPNYHLSISKPYTDIYDGYTSSCRNSIRKFVQETGKKDFAFAENVDPDVLIDLFRENRGSLVSELKNTHYRILESLIMECLDMNLGEIWLLHTLEGVPLAGAFFLDSPGRKIYLFAASTQRGRDRLAMFYLIDSYIRKYAGNRLILDFEGSAMDNLAHFYKGFGAQRVMYPMLRINKLPGFLRRMKPES